MSTSVLSFVLGIALLVFFVWLYRTSDKKSAEGVIKELAKEQDVMLRAQIRESDREGRFWCGCCIMPFICLALSLISFGLYYIIF